MPITVNCTCGKVFRVKDEMAGRAVTCQVCGNLVMAPAFNPVADAPIEQRYAPTQLAPSSAPAMIQCPACAEEIPANARLCPQCGEMLSKTLSKEDQAALLETVVGKLDAHIKDMVAQNDDRDIKGGSTSGKTIVAGIITAFAVFSIVMGAATRDGGGFIALGITCGLISGICLIISVLNDSKANNISTARTADEACSNYLKAVKTGRANKAFVALVPSARTVGPVKTMQFKDPKIPAHTKPYAITDVSSFKEYWKSIFAGPAGQNRAVAYNVKRVRNIGGDAALVEVEFSVTNYPSWLVITILINLIVCAIVIFAMQRKEKQNVRKLLIRRNGNWYIAESALTGTLDALTI